MQKMTNKMYSAITWVMASSFVLSLSLFTGPCRGSQFVHKLIGSDEVCLFSIRFPGSSIVYHYRSCFPRGGPGFDTRPGQTNFGAHLPHTPPPGRKGASSSVSRKGWCKQKQAPLGWQKNLSHNSRLSLSSFKQYFSAVFTCGEAVRS